jgi:hypothetical protein
MKLKDKCELWIKAAKEEDISDELFDVLSWQLAKNYSKLPKWFTNKVPEANLKMGTTFDMDVKLL